MSQVLQWIKISIVNIMTFKDENGKIAESNKDNARVAGENFTKVLSVEYWADWEHVDAIELKYRADELDNEL